MDPYNPLDKINLARSIESRLLAMESLPLGSTNFGAGAGVYALYYSGPFSAYALTRAGWPIPTDARPIYIGKAIPKGGRKGGMGLSATVGSAMRERLRAHLQSIEQATNLAAEDFFVRALIVDDIWIPLGENMLIETFRPVWNIALDGFGNKTPGRRRQTQFRSAWDVLHPGRAFATNLAHGPLSAEYLFHRVVAHLEGKPLPRPGDPVADVQLEPSDQDEA
jgi:hypothetical protein